MEEGSDSNSVETIVPGKLSIAREAAAEAEASRNDYRTESVVAQLLAEGCEVLEVSGAQRRRDTRLDYVGCVMIFFKLGSRNATAFWMRSMYEGRWWLEEIPPNSESPVRYEFFSSDYEFEDCFERFRFRMRNGGGGREEKDDEDNDMQDEYEDPGNFNIHIS